MQPEAAKLLADMQVAIRRIETYTSGASLDVYLDDAKLRDAVQWNFAVLGEALNQLWQVAAGIASEINEWRRIIAFRNQLIHGDGFVNRAITDIISRKLPVLRADVERLRAE